ncbi:EAL domain-containing protein [Oleiagrimonas sp. MCCC 1A03011]|uniref:EAL domain-containing protein n=1 Tax=Oleiagrimonas sp. MCCC 1A03011 TaxID=1926883 RepID=UPI001F0CBAC2|nr:EAL domain-containing protein [Oleiagrimonas sp. MCCC 1A03011]
MFAKLAPHVLIVAADRDDRRRLFDALDGQGLAALYTARDARQARNLLSESAELQAVILDFHGEAHENVALCAHLRSLPEAAGVHILGILSADPQQRSWGYQHVPPGVDDWLRSPIDVGETRVKLLTLLSGKDRKPAIVGAGAMGDYRFAFDCDDNELLVLDADNGEILDLNPSFERSSGYGREQLRGRDAAPLLGLSESQFAKMREVVEKDGVARRRCNRGRANGESDVVDLTMQPVTRGGQLVHLVSLRDRRELEAARMAMGLLARMQATGKGEDRMAASARLLADLLQLDYVAVYSARPELEDGPQLLTRELRRQFTSDAPDPLNGGTLKLVLDGRPVLLPAISPQVAQNDDFIARMGFGAFAGLPLLDERRNVLGALLIGSRDSWRGRPLLAETLRVAAARFGFDLELQRAREQGRAKGLQDGLTGLPNRLLFNDRLETTLREARRTGEMFAVLFVDLDRFKSINDSLGHSVGDKVLNAVAQRLRKSVRGSDTVARYAGDEFTVILRHITQRDDVKRIAEKIVNLMEVPLTLEGDSELRMTASIGISFYPDDATTADDLLKYADVAMYNAKGMGRNNYQVYQAVSEESSQQRIALESNLRKAEDNGELRVYYQPQIDVESEDIVGMEALVRWEHPELGMISPGFFIPLAEETGLIVGIGEWVLRTACADAYAWQQRYGLRLRVGVNLSAVQLRQKSLPKMVADALASSGLDPSSLELEVTESISVKSVTNLMENLDALHEIGCQIAIDDFGTGHASLDYLRRLPARRIKIDQSFVRNIGVDPDDEAIVKATIDMAHSLKRDVVAEGVEIEPHLRFLREQHCDEVQGYLFCRPLPAQAFDRMMAERQRLFGRRAEGGMAG